MWSMLWVMGDGYGITQHSVQAIQVQIAIFAATAKGDGGYP